MDIDTGTIVALSPVDTHRRLKYDRDIPRPGLCDEIAAGACAESLSLTRSWPGRSSNEPVA